MKAGVGVFQSWGDPLPHTRSGAGKNPRGPQESLPRALTSALSALRMVPDHCFPVTSPIGCKLFRAKGSIFYLSLSAPSTVLDTQMALNNKCCLNS